MAVNFFSTVNSLRDKLEEFRWIHRHGDGEAKLRPAVNHLQEELNKARVLLDDVGEGSWKVFPDEQRWGYLLLLSLTDTVRHDIKNL